MWSFRSFLWKVYTSNGALEHQNEVENVDECSWNPTEYFGITITENENEIIANTSGLNYYY